MDWFDYLSPSGLDEIWESPIQREDDDLIMLDFSGCEDKYIDKEGRICELL
jgi:hypothetical protein